jgi:hypothetical protein
VTTASLHYSKNGVAVKLDKRIVAEFLYTSARERKDAEAAARAYITDANKKGAGIKLKPGIEGVPK